MILIVVVAVLVILAVINIAVLVNITTKINSITNLLELHHNRVNHHMERYLDEKDSKYVRILNTLDSQTILIKQIPKEITVKNVLKLP